MKENNPVDFSPPVATNPSLLQRWSERKTRAQEMTGSASPESETAAPAPVLTDAHMPPVASLTEDSDYRGFLSPGVSEELKRLALRKLFHSAAYNVTDGLDDYAEDFTCLAKLGDVVTQEMRHRLAVEAERIAQSAPDNPSAVTPDKTAQTRETTLNTSSPVESLDHRTPPVPIEASQAQHGRS